MRSAAYGKDLEKLYPTPGPTRLPREIQHRTHSTASSVSFFLEIQFPYFFTTVLCHNFIFAICWVLFAGPVSVCCPLGSHWKGSSHPPPPGAPAPIIDDTGSDSMALDNVVEFLLADGSRTLPEIMIPRGGGEATSRGPPRRREGKGCGIVTPHRYCYSPPLCISMKHIALLFRSSYPPRDHDPQGGGNPHTEKY